MEELRLPLEGLDTASSSSPRTGDPGVILNYCLKPMSNLQALYVGPVFNLHLESNAFLAAFELSLGPGLATLLRQPSEHWNDRLRPMHGLPGLP